jgi:ATP-dependent DNA helicase RecG
MIADLSKDGEILKVARETAVAILSEDPALESDKNAMIRDQVRQQKKDTTNWARIS